MNRSVLFAVIAVIVIAVIGGMVLFNEFYIKGGTGEASQTLVAPELSLDETESEEMAADESAAYEETEEMMADEASTEEMADEAAEMTERRLYRITPDESQVMFEIDEMLAGAPKHVVGTTNQVTGDVIVDLADPAAAELGPLVINARTLTTDNDFRNRAIRSQILQSAEDEFEFITFTPTALTDLPADAVSVGDEVAFQIVGDLQIRDIVNTVTFDATVVITAEDRLEGSATAVVMRADYNLNIPEVPRVSDVAEEVPLTITFVALAVAE